MHCQNWPPARRHTGLSYQRTARYTYSAAGDRQAEPLATYRQQWERLEGREPQWQGI